MFRGLVDLVGSSGCCHKAEIPVLVVLCSSLETLKKILRALVGFGSFWW